MALECVRVGDASRLPNANAARTLSAQTSPILRLHKLCSEIACREVEVERVEANELGKEHVHRLRLALKVVPKDKTALL
jgi:hypothetical protein